MKKIIKTAFLLAAFAWAGTSCTQEELISGGQTDGEGIPVEIRINPGTRGPEDGDPADRKVESLRVLIYDKSGVLKWNFAPTDLEALTDEIKAGDVVASSTVNLPIRTGTYDFVYIANEGDLSNELNALAVGSTMTALQAMKFDRSAFAADKPIPMVNHYRNVKIDRTGVDTGTVAIPYDPYAEPGKNEDETKWEVPLERAGIRLKLNIYLREAEYSKWADKQIVIDSIPQGSFLLPGIPNVARAGDWVSDVSYPASSTAGEKAGFIEKKSGPAGTAGYDKFDYTVTYGRIILPEVIFTSVNTKTDWDKLPVLEITVDGKAKRGKISVDPTDGLGLNTGSYILPRNTCLEMSASIEQNGIVFSDIKVIDWGGKEDYRMGDRGTVIPREGIEAPPGVLGINSVTGELTLRGSVGYKNTPVATRADGKGTIEFGDLSNEKVYIAYFKWGSLIGLNGWPDKDPFSKDDIAWAPKEYDLETMFEAIDAAEAATYTGTDAEQAAARADAMWIRVPHATAWPETAVPAGGLGDPCAWADNGAFDVWKTPTAIQIPGSIGEVWNGGLDIPTEAAEPIAGTNGLITANRWTFLPNSGVRHSSGGPSQEVGTTGAYWSRRNFETIARTLMISTNGANQTVDVFAVALPIRCVPPTLTVDPKSVEFAWDVTTSQRVNITTDSNIKWRVVRIEAVSGDETNWIGGVEAGDEYTGNKTLNVYPKTRYAYDAAKPDPRAVKVVLEAVDYPFITTEFEIKQEREEPPYLRLNPSSLTFHYTGGTLKTTLESNTSWEITGTLPSWIESVSPSSGSGNALITVNAGSYSAGHGTSNINFKTTDGNNIPATLAVTQDRMDVGDLPDRWIQLSKPDPDATFRVPCRNGIRWEITYEVGSNHYTSLPSLDISPSSGDGNSADNWSSYCTITVSMPDPAVFDYPRIGYGTAYRIVIKFYDNFGNVAYGGVECNIEGNQ
jgi:hypothetical protein